MKKLVLSLVMVVGFANASQALAQLPAGRFTGMVSNNPFSEWCRLTDATVQFFDGGAGKFRMEWEEAGYAPQGGFCSLERDATFTPTGTNTWDVSFDDFNLNFGKAKLEGNKLTITASYNSMATGLDSLEAEFKFNTDLTRMDYERDIQAFSGPTLRATGLLTK